MFPGEVCLRHHWSVIETSFQAVGRPLSTASTPDICMPSVCRTDDLIAVFAHVRDSWPYFVGMHPFNVACRHNLAQHPRLALTQDDNLHTLPAVRPHPDAPPLRCPAAHCATAALARTTPGRFRQTGSCNTSAISNPESRSVRFESAGRIRAMPSSLALSAT